MKLRQNGRQRRITGHIGRLLWSAAGMAIGLGLVVWLGEIPRSPLLLASLGGSAVYLFGLTDAPAAQPRALFGGHLGSALIGAVCFHFFGDVLWMYLLAMILSFLYMLAAGTVHPPAAINPLIALQGQADVFQTWQPFALGLIVLFLVAVVWSRTMPGACRYPVKWFEKSPSDTGRGGWGEPRFNL